MRKKRLKIFNFFKADEEKIIISKKGLSDILATLMIILLVLVAVGVIWVVVRNIVQSGSEEIELGQFTLDLQIRAVQIQGGNVTVVVVKRNPGEGEFVGMNFVFSDGKNSETIRENITLKETEEKRFIFQLSEISTANLTMVSVVPIYKLSSGKETFGKVADTFDVPANKSLGAEQGEGTGTGGAVSESNGGAFEELGFVGTGTFSATVSSNPGIYPQFKRVVIDPLDVRVGDNQTFTAVVYSPYGIKNVTSVTQLDNSILNLPLQWVSGGETEDQTWNATWTVYDTHIAEYRTTFTVTDKAGNQDSVTLTWTDACADEIVPGSAESIILTPCTLNDMRGNDNGPIIVASGTTITLGSNATLVYTTSLSKTGTGKIVDSGGQIKKGYLYYYQQSGTVAVNATPVFGASATAPSGFIRVNSTTSINSCTASSGLRVCQSNYCTSDSDGGDAPLNYGTISGYNGACTNAACTIANLDADVCLDTTKLNERTCSSGSILNWQHNCQIDYGLSCSGGRCGA